MLFFLVHDFVYSNESLVEEWLFFTFQAGKNRFLYMRNEERKGFSEKELLKYHEAVNVCVCREPCQ